MLKTPRVFIFTAVLGAFLAAPAQAQQPIRSKIPDSLAKLAKIDETAARTIAMQRVPDGTIREVELERENGHLQYSYEFKVAGKKGTTEVNVDAISGKVIGTEHEPTG